MSKCSILEFWSWFWRLVWRLGARFGIRGTAPAPPPTTVRGGAGGGSVGLLSSYGREKKELSRCGSPGRRTSGFPGPVMGVVWCFSWLWGPTGPAHPRTFPGHQSGVGVGPGSPVIRKKCFGGRAGSGTGRKRAKTGPKITKPPENPGLRKPTGPDHLN